MMLGRSGHRVRFATPMGRIARGDEMMLSGRGLDPWGFVPGLSHVVGLGRFFRADHRGRDAYAGMVRSSEFLHPDAWDAVDLGAVDGLLLPGGHRARGMRPYLESPDPLRGGGGRLWSGDAGRRGVPRGACLAARTIDPRTGHSVLHGRRTTALTWSLEQRAWQVARRHPLLGFRLLPDLPRTTGSAPGVHVRAAGGHPGIGPSGRLLRRRSIRRRRRGQAERTGSGQSTRRPSGVRCPGRKLSVGTVAGRCPYLCQDIRRDARRLSRSCTVSPVATKAMGQGPNQGRVTVPRAIGIGLVGCGSNGQIHCRRFGQAGRGRGDPCGHRRRPIAGCSACREPQLSLRAADRVTQRSGLPPGCRGRTDRRSHRYSSGGGAGRGVGGKGGHVREAFGSLVRSGSRVGAGRGRVGRGRDRSASTRVSTPCSAGCVR